MTGLVLPQFVGTAASSWQLADWLTPSYVSDPAGSDGTCTIRCGQLDSAELWLVDHAVVVCDSSTATTVRWYESSPVPARLLDGSASGNFDVGDWPAGLVLRPSTELVVQWTGASVGARATLTLQIRQMGRA